MFYIFRIISETNSRFGIQYEYKFKCLKCGAIVEKISKNTALPRCLHCYPYPIKDGGSEMENELAVFILSLGVTVKQNDRTVLNGNEIDIYLPELKIGIEFNGLYWHAESTGNKPKNYHLNKTVGCAKKGVRLIHIFENEWLLKKRIVKNRLKHIINSKKFSLTSMLK